MATTRTFYVDATDGNNTTGDGSSGSPWKTLKFALEDASDGIKGTGNHYSEAFTDIVTSDDEIVVECSNGEDDLGSGYNGEPYVVGFTTDATHTITINGDNTTGKWDTSKYYLTRNYAAGVFEINGSIGNAYITLNNLQFEQTGSGTGIVNNGSSSSTSSELNIINCIFKGTTAASTCISMWGVGWNMNVVNCVIYGGWNRGYYQGYVTNSAIVQSVYNCTIDACDTTGIQTGSGTMTRRIYNNVVTGSGTSDYNIGTGTTATNGSGDTTSPDGASYQSMSFSFNDDTNGDFSLTAATPESGTDMSSDTAYAFSDDIIDTTRSTWDLGAFEYASETRFPYESIKQRRRAMMTLLTR